MIRRSRISVRPNVRPGGRGLSSSSQEPKPAGEAPPGSPKAQEKRDVAGREPQDEALKAGSESAPPPPPLAEDARAEQQASLNQEEKNHNVKASGSSIPTATPIQRRKRISAMPNVAKPRTAQPQARTPRPATSGTAKNKEPTPKDSAVLENTSPQTLPKSPGRRRASTGPQQLKVPDKKSGNLKEVKTAPASQEPAADSNRSRNDETQQTHNGSSPKLKTSQDSFCIDDHRPSPEYSSGKLKASQNDICIDDHHPHPEYSPGKLKASQNDICIDDHLPHPEYSSGKLKASQNDICIDDHHPHPEYSQGKLKDSQNSTCIEEKQRQPESSLPLKKSTASSDRERIIKARKLRELLKKEIRKEKKQQKGKTPDFEFNAPVDRSKMTMRDFIYYLPENNPMKSSLEEERREIEKVIGPMPSKEPANKAPLPPPVRDEDEDDNEEEDVEHVQDDQVLVPRVKVAEDGSIIIDEESLTVEVLRMQGPNVVEENDPVFERGSTTTYSSFRKSTHTKPWTNRETDMFFLAISMVGTDFSIIGQLFPHRARVEIKNKFKREERENSWRIDKAFREKRPFDFEFFSQLLERILKDDEKKRLNKNKVTLGKKPANPKRRKKEKKADQNKAPDGGGSVEVSDSEVAEGEADAETAEKENEDSLNVNEGEASTAGDPDAKKKRKRKKNDAESGGPATKKPSEDSSERQQKKAKKRKRIKSVEICEDSEEVDYENMPPLEESPGSSPSRKEDSDTPEVAAQIKKQQIEEEDVSGPAEETAGPEAAETPKLGQRSRLQKPKPCLKLATKRGAKAAVDKPNELSQASHFISHEQAAEPHYIDSAIEGTATSHLKRSTTRDRQPSSGIQETEEEEHDITAIQKKMLHKPTRSGRIPKLSSHLKQPEDDEPPAASPPASPPSEAASPPASPPSETASPQRRGRGRPPQSQKPKPSTLKGRDQKKDPRPGKTALVTLRASVKETEENSDEEGESVMEEEGDSFSMNPEEVNQAPAFVPVSLRSPAPVPAQVEETMEELELSVSVPDTRCTIEPEHLHHSDSVCSQSLDQSPVEAAVTENCLHLLVDVVEVSTPENDEDNSLPVNDSNTDSDRSCLAVKKDLVSQPSSAAGPGDNGSGVSEEPPCQALKPGLVEVEKAATVSQDSVQPAHSQAVTCEATTQVLHEAPSETPSEETAGSAQALRDPCTLDEAANTIGVVNAPEVSHGSETPSQNQERGRRSRFPKPKPNLGGKTTQPRSLKTKPPQSDSGQGSCDKGDASQKAEVHIVQQKPAEEKESEVDSCKDEGVSKELREVKASSLSSSEEGLRKDGTNIVVNAPEVSHGSETPSQNQERGGRSRFPKPKPNLGGKTTQPRSLKTKHPQSDSGQGSCDKGDASQKAEVHIVQQKPAEEKESEVDSCKDEGVSKELREVKASSLSSSEEGLRKDGTNIVVNAPEVSHGSETPSQNQERGRRSRFPKPKPNLGGKTTQPRSLKTKHPQSDSGQDSCDKGGASSSPAVDIVPHCTVDGKKCDSSRDECVPEKLGDKDSSSSAEGLKQDDTSIPALESLPKPTGEDERVEKRPAKAPLRRPKPNLSGKLRSRIPPEKDASAAASTGQEQNAIPEDGTVSTLDSPVSKKAEVRSPKADESPSTSVISQNTEGSLAANEFPQQEPTFILTLFEIPPSLLGEYDDSTSSLSTISAELLSSPVFVDHVPAELPETQSLVSEAVEVESYSMSGCPEDAGIVSLDQFSQPVYRSGEEEKPKELPATSAHVKDLTTDLGDEEYVSITLEPVEDFPAAAEADSAETSSNAAQQSRQKNKPPGRARRGKLHVKPNTLKKKPAVSTRARGALKVVHIEPQERPLPAETASCTPLPQPAEQQITQERPLPAETASCTPVPQPAEQQTTQERPLPAETASCTPLPQPAEQQTTQERPLPAETASCTPLPQSAEQQTTQERPLPTETASCTHLPQPAEQQTTQEECSQHEGKEASNSSVKTAEPSIENIGAGEHLTPSTPNTLPPSGTPLIRPGRKPKGFLSFISQKSSSDNVPKPHRTSSQKPQINTARLDRKRTASAPAVDLSSESSAVSPPSAGIGLCASSSSTPATEGVGSTSSHLIHFPMTESCSSEPHIEEVFCTKNSAADEEPTSISQYFFSDIFTEVDDPD
ncbi:transcription factor TFIIIB component B'' homolog isoform X2 [Acipenser ruthenus]|uniref:transcription factor TFIIIB component B'' homolog isoform X2 n=1 Tax=Acipenser ruthenus TaxID=7906 RepID=UPI002740AFF0|nr:transcription factor TFIIIB component B'' homolog isoform X2 [Acipenser ruthenus]